jgi:putative membrane protein
MKLIVELILKSLILLLTTYIVPGFKIDSYLTALMVAVVLAILNVLLKPILILFTLPATILTLGLFLFVINAVLLVIASSLIRGFHIDSFFTAIIAAIVITLLSTIINSLLK